MHALLVTVDVDPQQVDASRRDLREQVVPRVSSSPGFVHGYWTAGADRTRGLSLVVFGSEQDAENAAKMVRQAPTATGVVIRDVEVREVIADA